VVDADEVVPSAIDIHEQKNDVSPLSKKHGRLKTNNRIGLDVFLVELCTDSHIEYQYI
jgi:hypothetical protein